MSKNKCGPGQIEKNGYQRKGYQRKGYTKKNGTVVPSTYVSAAIVEPTCIKDTGKPGKSSKILPKPGNDIHLSKYGYGIHKTQAQRRSALRAASKEHNTLVVLRRLNLLRNYQTIPENKNIFSNDVEYMKKLYSKNNQSNIKNKKSLQTGGNDKTKYIEVVSKFNSSNICDEEGKCEMKNVIYESHIVDGRQIVFYTLGDNDASEVYELEKKHCKTNKIEEDFLNMIKKNKGYLIGIKVDNILEGYCCFEPKDKSKIEIKRCCVNKGYETALYTFMERFFQKNNYDEITTKIDFNDFNFTKKINFQYGAGFTAFDISEYNKEIYFRKEI